MEFKTLWLKIQKYLVTLVTLLGVLWTLSPLLCCVSSPSLSLTLIPSLFHALL